MRKLILFDIDGTLVLTGGAGLRAMNRACAELVGHADALDGIPVAGRTDRSILADVAARAGRTLDAELLDELRERYVASLREEIELPGRAAIKAVMPGIRDLLDALRGRDDVFLGLLTGNFEAGARIKLEHFDLWRYFRCGAFGDDAPIATRWCRSRSNARARCGLPDLAPRARPRRRRHAARCRVRPRGRARRRSASRPGRSRSNSCARPAPTIVFEDLSDTDAFLESAGTPV